MYFLLGGELESLESLAACLITFAEWIVRLSRQEIKRAKMQLLENWTHPMSYAKHVSTCTRKQETTFCSQNAWWGFSLSQSQHLLWPREMLHWMSGLAGLLGETKFREDKWFAQGQIQMVEQRCELYFDSWNVRAFKVLSNVAYSSSHFTGETEAQELKGVCSKSHN